MVQCVPIKLFSTKCYNGPVCLSIELFSIQCHNGPVCVPIKLFSTKCYNGPVCVPIELSSTQCDVGLLSVPRATLYLMWCWSIECSQSHPLPNVMLVYCRGAHTFSACKLLLKWPSQNDLPTLKILNIYYLYIYIYWVHFIYKIYVGVLAGS